jgi:hypothetical protein
MPCIRSDQPSFAVAYFSLTGTAIFPMLTLSKNPYQNVIISPKRKVVVSHQKKDGMLNINNISVKDQRLKHYHPPIFYPKKPHNNLVERSREKNSGLKESFYLPVPITKSNERTSNERCGVVNKSLEHTKAFMRKAN